MNKPTFRAWQKYHKAMCKVRSIDWEDNEIKALIVEYPEEYKNIKQVYSINSSTRWLYDEDGDMVFILMQSTGLKGYMDESFNDNEEKEVFRGDVIDIFWEEYPAGYYQENHMIGVVDLDETGTAWIIKNGKYDWDNPTPIPSEIDGMSIARSLPDEEDLEEVFLHNFNLTSADITILGSIHEKPELLNEVSG